MPRFVTNSGDRWLHPHYRKAYCFKYRNGMVYTCVDSVRQATGFEWNRANKKLCLDILDKRVNEKIYGKQDNRDEIYLLDLIKRFHKDQIKKTGPEQQRQYKIIYKKFLNENRPLSQLKDIRLSIIDAINTSKLAAATLKKRLIRIKRIFNYAIDLEWIEKNPITKSMLPTAAVKEVIVCSNQHLELLIEHFKSNNNTQMVLLIRFLNITAFRIQEALNMTWSDFHENYLLIKGKGSKFRVLPLKSFPELNPLIEEIKTLNPDKPFLWSHQQTPAKSMRRAMITLAKEHPELTWNITFHVLRKTTINYWRNKGVETEVRNMIAGHTKDVEKVYYLTDPDIEYLEKKLEILSKM